LHDPVEAIIDIAKQMWDCATIDAEILRLHVVLVYPTEGMEMRTDHNGRGIVGCPLVVPVDQGDFFDGKSVRCRPADMVSGSHYQAIELVERHLDHETDECVRVAGD
jgi:hypothetical protein